MSMCKTTSDMPQDKKVREDAVLLLHKIMRLCRKQAVTVIRLAERTEIIYEELL